MRIGIQDEVSHNQPNAMIFNPDYVDFYNDFAETMLEMSNWEAARYLLTRAILLDMKNYRLWFNLIAVNFCGTKSDNTELNAQVDMPDGGQIRTYAFSVRDDARRHDVEICLRQVLHLCPTHPIAGNMYTKLFGTKYAVPLEAPDLQELVSVLHLGERELGKAIEDTDWPKEAVEVFQRAEVLRYKGAMPEAIREMESASRIHPTSPDISLNLSLLLDSTGEKQRAMDVLEQALKRFPWHRELSLTYSGVLRDTGRHREAIVAAQRAIAADCMAPGSWLTLCRAYVKSDKLPQARDALKEALRLCKPWSWELFSAFELCRELDVSHPRVW
ncbi:MAG: tetratricopeptide repeat protein [Candidatus Hodarchaeota archaeon]